MLSVYQSHILWRASNGARVSVALAHAPKRWHIEGEPYTPESSEAIYKLMAWGLLRKTGESPGFIDYGITEAGLKWM
jgi:hypothetical protein